MCKLVSNVCPGGGCHTAPGDPFHCSHNIWSLQLWLCYADFHAPKFAVFWTFFKKNGRIFASFYTCLQNKALKSLGFCCAVFEKLLKELQSSGVKMRWKKMQVCRLDPEHLPTPSDAWDLKPVKCSTSLPFVNGQRLASIKNFDWMNTGVLVPVQQDLTTGF